MQYVANSGAVTLSAATAKTVLMIQSTAKIGGMLVEFSVEFNGTTSANEPVLIELVKCTNASNATPGTGNTEVTPVQSRGNGNTGAAAAIAATMTAFANCTSEPTVEACLKEWRVSPTSGMIYQAPLGREAEIPAVASPFAGLGIRCTAAQEVKCRAYMEWIQGPS
jgi:hypothetical protein